MGIHENAITQVHANAEVAAEQFSIVQAELFQAQSEVARLAEELEACQNPPAPVPSLWIGRNEGSPELDMLLPQNKVIRAFEGFDIEGALTAGNRVYASSRSVSGASALATQFSGAENLFVTVHHEPENDNISFAEFRQEQADAFEAVDGRLPIVPVLMASTFNANEQDEWIDLSLPYAAIGVDGYLRNYPWQSTGFLGVFKGALAYAKATEMPLAICEVGVMQKLNNTVVPESLQAAEITRLAQIVTDNTFITDVMYFHEAWTKEGTTRDYRFLGRPQVEEAFSELFSVR